MNVDNLLLLAGVTNVGVLVCQGFAWVRGAIRESEQASELHLLKRQLAALQDHMGRSISELKGSVEAIGENASHDVLGLRRDLESMLAQQLRSTEPGCVILIWISLGELDRMAVWAVRTAIKRRAERDLLFQGGKNRVAVLLRLRSPDIAESLARVIDSNLRQRASILVLCLSPKLKTSIVLDQADELARVHGSDPKQRIWLHTLGH